MINLVNTAESIFSNVRLKEYPSKTVLQISNRAIFKESGWEAHRNYDVPSKGKAVDPERSMENSRARAKRSILDIALCNQFDFFFTWTLDKSLIDRYDSAEVTKKVQTFLKNATYRKGFQYICVPEFHEDGAIHFHGLCNLGEVEIKRADRDGKELTTNAGQPIYNMTSWKWGFSTCIPLNEDYNKVCSYISKYVTKSDSKVLGKWYFSSRSLRKKPNIIILPCVDYEAFKQENPKAFTQNIYGNVSISIVELEDMK